MRLLNISVALLTISLPLAATEPDSMAGVLQPYLDRHELAGAVGLVVSKEKILSLEAVGYSDVAARKPMEVDTLFWLASMSKPITATTLMMLVDEGKVQLDDPVEKYLPRFTPRIVAVIPDGAHVRLQKPHHTVTVRSLLNHTSGVTNTPLDISPTIDAFSLATRVEGFALYPLQFEPGSNFSYGFGLDIAGRIIEVASGVRFEEFLQRRLFEPLGMKDTTFWPSEAQVRRLAKGYRTNVAGTDVEETPIVIMHHPLTDRTKRSPSPGGGLFSTASDLGKFARMILNGGSLAGKRYLSEAAIHEMSRNQLSGKALQSCREYIRRIHYPADLNGYGLGWLTNTWGAFSHEGAWGTNMRIDPKLGLASVWLIQNANPPDNRVDKSWSTFQQYILTRFAAALEDGSTR